MILQIKIQSFKLILWKHSYKLIIWFIDEYGNLIFNLSELKEH